MSLKPPESRSLVQSRVYMNTLLVGRRLAGFLCVQLTLVPANGSIATQRPHFQRKVLRNTLLQEACFIVGNWCNSYPKQRQIRAGLTLTRWTKDIILQNTDILNRPISLSAKRTSHIFSSNSSRSQAPVLQNKTHKIHCPHQSCRNFQKIN